MIILSENGHTVHRTMTHRCACYIIETDKYSILVDTSMRFEKGAVLKSIQSVGAKVDAIFLTHSHTDHAANAKYFSDVFDCKVYISKKGITKIRQGCCTMPKGTNLFTRLIHRADSQIPFYQ